MRCSLPFALPEQPGSDAPHRSTREPTLRACGRSSPRVSRRERTDAPAPAVAQRRTVWEETLASRVQLLGRPLPKVWRQQARSPASEPAGSESRAAGRTGTASSPARSPAARHRPDDGSAKASSGAVRARRPEEQVAFPRRRLRGCALNQRALGNEPRTLPPYRSSSSASARSPTGRGPTEHARRGTPTWSAARTCRRTLDRSKASHRRTCRQDRVPRANSISPNPGVSCVSPYPCASALVRAARKDSSSLSAVEGVGLSEPGNDRAAICGMEGSERGARVARGGRNGRA